MKPDPTRIPATEDGTTDELTTKQRRLAISRIRGRAAGSETLIRHRLDRRGLRSRLDGAGIPITPDLVIPTYRTLGFVNGRSWHSQGYLLFDWPNPLAVLWESKSNRNVERDRGVRVT